VFSTQQGPIPYLPHSTFLAGRRRVTTPHRPLVQNTTLFEVDGGSSPAADRVPQFGVALL